LKLNYDELLSSFAFNFNSHNIEDRSNRELQEGLARSLAASQGRAWQILLATS